MRGSPSNAAVRLVTANSLETDEGARLAIKAAGEGTWEIRMNTGEHLLSARSRQLLGIEGAEVISTHAFLAALHPDDRERWKDAMSQVLDAERTGEFHIEFRAADSDERWLAASGRVLFKGVSAARVVGTLQDISVQRRTEEWLRLRLGQLGHDLRVPLNVISMGIQLVKREVKSKEDVLSTMQLTVERMDHLIDQLLRFARGGAGDLLLNREWVPLVDVCRQVMDEASIAHPGHPLKFQQSDDVLGEWDRERLFQLVRNLLANALTHGAAGEPVTVSVIDCRDEALLIVANRGEPIPARFREYLHDPESHGAPSSEHLGLYIVKEIVIAHRGRIEVSSDPGGTVIHVWLPKISGSLRA